MNKDRYIGYDPFEDSPRLDTSFNRVPDADPIRSPKDDELWYGDFPDLKFYEPKWPKHPFTPSE
jgi:hypothetical protein